jgi:hypothetical protein
MQLNSASVCVKIFKIEWKFLGVLVHVLLLAGDFTIAFKKARCQRKSIQG